MNHSVAIIGSGPAGLTAAIYTSRAFLQTTVYAGMQPGGQLTLTTEVENFPGFPEGIMGPDLMNNMQRQAERFGAQVIPRGVESLEVLEPGKGFIVHDNFGQSMQFDSIIVSSGASARYLGLPEESKFHGKGYHSCATCDGFFYKEKDIMVIGGGDSAMEEANFLTKFAKTVTIVHRSKSFRASPIMLKRAQENPKIRFIVNTKITQLIGENKLTAVELTNTETQEKSIQSIDAVFVAIGHTPNTHFAQGILSMDEVGYLHPTSRTMSNVPGIFIAGDVSDRDYRQAITAAGEGCKAAIDAEKWLQSH